MSAISLFGFLNDHMTEILDQTDERLRGRWGEDRKPGRAFRPLLRRLVDGYLDVLVTGKADVLERIARPFVRSLPAHGLAYRDALAVPLTIASVTRRLLMEEYERRRDSAGADPPSAEDLHDDIERLDDTAYVAAGNVLDLLQRHVHETVSEHNEYLQRLHEAGGARIEPLRLGHRVDS